MKKIAPTADLLKPISREQLASLSRKDLIELVVGEQDLRMQAEGFARVLQDETYQLGDFFVRVRNQLFGKSSEKRKRENTKRRDKNKDNKKKPVNRNLKPSERYPNANIVTQDIELDPVPSCRCCGHQMQDSGMTEVSEILSVIPKQYIIKRQIRHKYRCSSCHSDLQTAPALPRIKPGSSYDDEFVIDVAMSKYCDLIPIERYAQMASRIGFEGLPPHSLIELTHYLADFLEPVYQLIKQEILAAKVLSADETTHRMLEGDSTSNWYLWGFSTEKSCYFEHHNTRSGDVASEILLQGACEYLVSDVYSGYHKAVRVSNESRLKRNLPAVVNVYCNAHARRKFGELNEESEVAEYFLEQYGKIYKLAPQNAVVEPNSSIISFY